MLKNKLFSVFCLLLSSTASATATKCDEFPSLALKTQNGTMTISQRMEDQGIHGLSLALVENFSVSCVYTAGFINHKNEQPIQPDTLFQVASISKTVTAIAVLKLVHKGQIALTSNVNHYLKRWKLKRSNRAFPISTVEQLMNHTGGINVSSFAGYAKTNSLPDTLQILNGQSPANSETVMIEHGPNEKYQYSGGGYTVLELMIEDVTKQRFTAHINESVLHPLGMENSYFDQPASQFIKDRMAHGYSERLPKDGGYFNYPELAAAGMWSTSSDVARLIAGLQKSIQPDMKGLLSPEIMQKMLTPVKDSMSGLGIVIDDMYFSHTGHNNGYVSMMLGHDSDGYGLAILTNAEKPRIISEIIVAVGTKYKWEDF